MADVPTEQAIAISTGVVSALSAAGVLHGQGAPPTPTPPPDPGPEVGDVVVAHIRQIGKFVGTNPSEVKVQLWHADKDTTYELGFPPNDEKYLAEFHRLFTIDRPILIRANMRILEKLTPNSFAVEMGVLWVIAGFAS